MSEEITLPREDRKDVTVLALAEIMLCKVANRQQPRTRRSNKLAAAIANIESADDTYPGSMQADFKARLEMVADELEQALIAFCEA
jgi:2-iminoacetate synthase ThiH